MNKYERALKILSASEQQAWKERYDGYDFQEAKDSLKELVEKATPKKPEYEGDSYYKGEIVYDTWICPSCGERYEVDYHDYEYCPKCGQHIDLTQEEEEYE